MQVPSAAPVAQVAPQAVAPTLDWLDDARAAQDAPQPAPSAVPISTTSSPAPWYFTRDGKKYGPFTTDHLKQFANSSKLLPTDLLWKEGMQGWKPASKVKGLFAAQQPPSQPAAQAQHSASPSNSIESLAASNARPLAQAMRQWHGVSPKGKLAMIGGAVAVPLVLILLIALVMAGKSRQSGEAIARSGGSTQGSDEAPKQGGADLPGFPWKNINAKVEHEGFNARVKLESITRNPNVDADSLKAKLAGEWNKVEPTNLPGGKFTTQTVFFSKSGTIRYAGRIVLWTGTTSDERDNGKFQVVGANVIKIANKDEGEEGGVPTTIEFEFVSDDEFVAIYQGERFGGSFHYIDGKFRRVKKGAEGERPSDENQSPNPVTWSNWRRSAIKERPAALSQQNPLNRKDKDDGPARFDPDSLERTVQWAEQIFSRLRKDAINSIRYRATLEKLSAEVATHKNKIIRWVLPVQSVQEDAVLLSMSLRDWRLQLSPNPLALTIGPLGISKEKAATINPGDKITVRATVSRLTLTGEELGRSAGRILIVLKDLQVAESEQTKQAEADRQARIQAEPRLAEEARKARIDAERKKAEEVRRAEEAEKARIEAERQQAEETRKARLEMDEREAEKARIAREEIEANKLLRQARRLDAQRANLPKGDQANYKKQYNRLLKEIIVKYPDTPSAATARNLSEQE